MLKTYLYVPEELNKQIESIAKEEDKSKAEVMRNALKEGIQVVRKRKYSSASALLKIAEIARNNKVSGPKDASANMDKYLWGKDWGQK